MKITNRHNIPAPIVRAIEDEQYDSQGSDATATSLINPPQIKLLEEKHWNELEVDAVDCLASLDGTIAHSILEHYAQPPDELPEERFFAEIDGWKVSGQADLIERKTACLSDYKKTSAWSVVYGKKEWEEQLNILDYLARANGEHIEHLQIVAWYKDWKRNESARSGDYPNEPLQVLPIKKWTKEEQEQFVMDCVADHQDSRENGARPCTEGEKWQKPAKWALMKEGKKSAEAVEDTMEALFTRMDKKGIHYTEEGEPPTPYYIDHRPGEAVRCASYCTPGVNGVCPQKKREENG